MIKRILVPLDFSDASLVALEYAIEFGRPFKPEFLVIHAIDPISFMPLASAYGMGVDTGVVFEALERAGREQLSRLAANLQKRHLTVRTRLQVGTPYQVIVDTATKLRADLIIMSTQGRTGFSHVMLGSVAEKVVRLATCAVLTVRPHRPRAGRSQRKVTRPGLRRRRRAAASK